MLKKDKSIPYSSFIGGYYIDSDVCDMMIDYFNQNKERCTRGHTSIIGVNQVHEETKDSLDYYFHPHEVHTPIYEYKVELQKCLDMYCQDYDTVQSVAAFNLNIPANIQYYPAGGGYKVWHCERSGLATSDRILVFLTYLNDVKDGGTEFYYQKLKTQAKKGLTIICPTDWTHTHRSVVSKTEEKYIATGWYTHTGQ